MSKYLLRRPGSQNWRIRLQCPGKPAFEVSLGTANEREAEIIALRDYGDKIAEHKAAILARQPRVEPTWEQEFKPGLHVAPDGSRVFAIERELHHLDAQGATVRTTANGGPAWQISRVPRLGLDVPVTIAVAEAKGPLLAVKNGDDKLFDAYVRDAGLTGYYLREAETVWALYKTLSKGKPLADATRDDGRALADHFAGQGIKPATVRKKVGWLAAVVNMAIRDGKLTLNPFSGVVPKEKTADKIAAKRQPLSEADMRECKRNLGRLSESDQLLFRLLAATGMRLSEAFEVQSEMQERKVRYVIVGSKTETSLRRVPLPAAVLPQLPKIIKGQLFEGGPKAASKRLARFLDDCGITDPRKVGAHSLRHRAKDRLRAAECPLQMQWALLGHEENTVSEDYGKGFSVPQLKRWIDKIGF